MSERTMSRIMTLIVPAISVSSIAITVLSSNLGSAEPAAKDSASKDCLSGPKGSAPEGSHWYYRVDRANNNRRCWYLGSQGKNTRQFSISAPQTSPPSASSTSLQPPPRSVTRQDERSELTQVESPIINPRETAAAPAYDEPVSIPSGVVTSFSESWPSLPGTEDAWRLRLSAMRRSYAEEPAATEQAVTANDNAQLVSPVRTESASGNVRSSMEPGLAMQQILPWLIGAMGLAGVIAGFICTHSTSRRQPRADHRYTDGITRVTLRPSGELTTRPGPRIVARDRSDMPRAPSWSVNWVESASVAKDRGQQQREFEERLQEITRTSQALGSIERVFVKLKQFLSSRHSGLQSFWRKRRTVQPDAGCIEDRVGNGAGDRAC